MDQHKIDIIDRYIVQRLEKLDFLKAMGKKTFQNDNRVVWHHNFTVDMIDLEKALNVKLLNHNAVLPILDPKEFSRGTK